MLRYAAICAMLPREDAAKALFIIIILLLLMLCCAPARRYAAARHYAAARSAMRIMSIRRHTPYACHAML